MEPGNQYGTSGLPCTFNRSDAGIEDAIYDSYIMRSFMHFSFLTEQVLDTTALLYFRYLLEKNRIDEMIFADVKNRLERTSLIMYGDSIIDATLIATPPPTKNKQEEKRDDEMHRSKKGNQWYFGMKVHAGVDARSGYVHAITGTAGNVHDVAETPNLAREDDRVVYGGSGYLDAPGRINPYHREHHLPEVEFRINVHPSSLKMKDSYRGINWDKEEEYRKSAVRYKVEHPFLIVKRQFDCAKVVYHRAKENMSHPHILFVSVNPLMCLRAGRWQGFIDRTL